MESISDWPGNPGTHDNEYPDDKSEHLQATYAALAESERRFRTITNAVPQVIWENDPEGKAIYFNHRWFEFSGLTVEQSRGIGWPVMSHPEDNIAIEKWQAALQSEEIFESEARLRGADGIFYWHLLRNVPLKDAAGKVIGWFGTATNIQPQKEAQLLYNHTSQRLRAVLETAVDFAIITLDKEGLIIDWNSGAEKMFGYKREEVLGCYTDLIFTPEDKYGDIAAVEIEKARLTGQSLDERWHVRKDGTRFFMSGVMTPIRHTEISGYVKITRNITDRKLAEEALYMSEQRKSLAIQSAEMGEWDWEIDIDLVHGSEQACKLLDLPDDRKQAKFSTIMSRIHHEDKDAVQNELQAALNGLNIFQSEFRIRHNDSDTFVWINAYGRVVSHINDQPVKMIGVVYDITSRKQLEKQKDDFIGLASHELRSPVTSIKAYGEILQDMAEQGERDEQTKVIKKMNVQVDRMVSLIYNLLDYTTLSEVKMKLFPESGDVNVLIQNHLPDLQLLSASHKLIFEPGRIGLVKVDINRIGQVINNLVSNAIKYSPANTEVIIRTEDLLSGVKISVRDFGLGIPQADQAHIFEQYYRVSGAPVQSNIGLGLGLYIASGIVKQHHGTIGVESVVGEGSTFYFTLPYS